MMCMPIWVVVVHAKLACTTTLFEIRCRLFYIFFWSIIINIFIIILILIIIIIIVMKVMQIPFMSKF
jgi:hypothetical protein